MRQPDDPGPTLDECRNKFDNSDAYDPTGYYERKRKHREEMLPLLAWCFGAALLIVAGIVIWELVT